MVGLQRSGTHRPPSISRDTTRARLPKTRSASTPPLPTLRCNGGRAPTQRPMPQTTSRTPSPSGRKSRKISRPYGTSGGVGPPFPRSLSWAMIMASRRDATSAGTRAMRAITRVRLGDQSAGSRPARCSSVRNIGLCVARGLSRGGAGRGGVLADRLARTCPDRRALSRQGEGMSDTARRDVRQPILVGNGGSPASLHPPYNTVLRIRVGAAQRNPPSPNGSRATIRALFRRPGRLSTPPLPTLRVQRRPRATQRASLVGAPGGERRFSTIASCTFYLLLISLCQLNHPCFADVRSSARVTDAPYSLTIIIV